MRNSVKVFGLIEYESGRTSYDVIDAKLNATSFMSFLKMVLTATRIHLPLIQDRTKYHYADDVLRFLGEKKKRIKPFKIPAYFPELNPVEGLWKKVKAKGTHLVYFGSFEKLIDRVAATMEWFASKPEEVIPLFGKYEMA